MSETVVGTLLREVEWIRRRLDAMHRTYPCCGNQALRHRLKDEQRRWQERCQEIKRCQVRLESGIGGESLHRQLLKEQLNRALKLTSPLAAL